MDICTIVVYKVTIMQVRFKKYLFEISEYIEQVNTLYN